MSKYPQIIQVNDYHEFENLNTKNIKVIEIGFEPYSYNAKYVGLAYVIGKKPKANEIKDLLKKVYPELDPNEILNN